LQNISTKLQLPERHLPYELLQICSQGRCRKFFGRTTQSHDRMNIHGIIFEYTHTAARLTDKNLTNLNNAFVRQLMHDSVTSVMFAMLGEPQSYWKERNSVRCSVLRPPTKH